MNEIAWIWIGITIFSIVFEAITVTLVTIWFIPGAITATIFALTGLPLWAQLTAFFVISAICLVFFMPWVRKKKIVHTNADSVIGKKAVVTEKVDNIAGAGACKIEGKEWTARSAEENVTFEVGEIAVIKEISGVKLILVKEEKEE
ncbi:MAG: NfeD family protein [Clostridiales bacterium]|nr:NfeD family protein [Clostridiales bacterium]